MGMFDFVHYKCPKCGCIVEEQSKASGCDLKHYFIGDIAYELPVFTDCDDEVEDVYPAPLEILAEAIKCGLECSECGHRTQGVLTQTLIFKPYKGE